MCIRDSIQTARDFVLHKGIVPEFSPVSYTHLDVYKRQPYYVNCDMSKYIAYIIDTLNHDTSISSLLRPLNRINKLLKEMCIRDRSGTASGGLPVA